MPAPAEPPAPTGLPPLCRSLHRNHPNQIEIYFSVLQRKAPSGGVIRRTPPNHALGLGEHVNNIVEPL